MAEINTPQQGQNRGSKTAARSLRVDMTPMVDLGFLLITFFIFTSVVSKPTAMKLILPTDGSTTDVPVTKTITVLLGDANKAVCYEGFVSADPRISKVNTLPGSDELRNVIESKQQSLRSNNVSPDSLIVVIKPGENSNYEQLVTVLDEMAICDVKRHVLANMDEAELKLLRETR